MRDSQGTLAAALTPASVSCLCCLCCYPRTARLGQNLEEKKQQLMMRQKQQQVGGGQLGPPQTGASTSSARPLLSSHQQQHQQHQQQHQHQSHRPFSPLGVGAVRAGVGQQRGVGGVAGPQQPSCSVPGLDVEGLRQDVELILRRV